MELDWCNGHLCHHTVPVTIIRKPLLFLLVLSCAASLAASGRFSLRLFFDTSIALAALPIIQVIAFSVAYWTGRRPVGYTAAVDDYFDCLWPWFFALALLGSFAAIVSPATADAWFSRVGALAGAAALIASLRVDFLYFHRALGRAPGRAAADVIVQRAIGWSATFVYFLVTAVPKIGSFIPDVAANLFGATR
jgi:hypothetical protein